MKPKPHPYLGDLLDETRAFLRRYVVFGDAEADAAALWNAHTFVYDCAPATPYLHPHSPEPASGKTTLLDALSLTACNAVQADNLTEAVLFRLVDARHPTLLFDEIDAVFGKTHSDSTEGIRQVLNSGYRRGKQAWRCVGAGHELKAFDCYCPKATAGLHELPGTLASRAIPIEMKPPRPDEHYEDLDLEEAEPEAEILRRNLESWAEESLDTLADPNLKPPKLTGLTARGNEIWRILFRIADHAGGDWPERAREAALLLSGRARQHEDTSAGIKLLAHIHGLFAEERITCHTLVGALNADDELPYGGWNDGKGITTRELGRKLTPYGVRAKPIRIEGERAGNGYERRQFEDAWSRYLAQEPVQPVQAAWLSQKPASEEPVQPPSVPVVENGANPHEQRVVPVGLVERSKTRNGRVPRLGEPGYPMAVDAAFGAGHITADELRMQLHLSSFVFRRRAEQAIEAAA